MKKTEDNDLWAWAAIAAFVLVPSALVWLMVLAMT
jgi:hypothetical protein